MLTVSIRACGGPLVAALLVGLAGCGPQTPAPGAQPLSASQRAQLPNPYPRQVLSQETVATWTFASGPSGWGAAGDCSVRAQNGTLVVEATGSAPTIRSPKLDVPGSLVVGFRARGRCRGYGQLQWALAGSSEWLGQDTVMISMIHDGQWHEYSVRVPAEGHVAGLSLSPSLAPGRIEIEWIRLDRQHLHPVEITAVEPGVDSVAAVVRNHADRTIAFEFGGKRRVLEGGGMARLTAPLPKAGAFPAATFRLVPEGLPPVTRPVFLFRPEVQMDWVTLQSAELTVQVAPDGSGARLLRGGVLVGVICPLLHLGGAVPSMRAARVGAHVELVGQGVKTATLTLTDLADELNVRIEADSQAEGPVVRAVGPLEQGLLAGVEYLGEGERSSSRADVLGPAHVRYAPDPAGITMPLMAFVTDCASVAMLWRDTSLQPLYATPNFFDGTEDHRMALRGRRIEATLRVTEGWSKGGSLADAILWAARRRGLPALPPAPRGAGEEMRLCLSALEGPLAGPGGWGHAAELRWQRLFYADQASTIWRISGRMPEVKDLVPGGSHLANPAAFFLAGQADRWLTHIDEQARLARDSQQPDGSFLLLGERGGGPFEGTGAGYCAAQAWDLLEHAWYTGDRRSLSAAFRALDRMKQFRVPSGARPSEVPLHTPDLLSVGLLVRAYVRGYELLGRREYIDQARRWALAGLAFVYQWSDRPVMAYATVPALGATGRAAPVWLGLPAQWCGLVYARSLLMLAGHDDALPWRRVAEGILTAGEQMQYTQPPYVGCLPDSYGLAVQEGNPWAVNPCGLVSVRLALQGRLVGLDVARSGSRRVVAPFPVEIRDGKADIQARPGVSYQVLIDGKHIVTVQSRGLDVVELP